MKSIKAVLFIAALVAVIGAGAYVAGPFRARFEANRACCQVPFARNLRLTVAEAAGRVDYPSEIGQDKWVLETMFPDVTDGFFVDVGSGHGALGSNTVALERRGWKGICIDPFPVHMEGRTCQMFKDVVFSESGRRMTFHMAGGLAGLADTLGKWNEQAKKAPTVDFTTVTLAEILDRGQAPPFIHFISLDIEGAELDALEAFPFDRVRVGSFAIEHNEEEPKRTRIKDFLARHGYDRVHSFKQDDFYAPAVR